MRVSIYSLQLTCVVLLIKSASATLLMGTHQRMCFLWRVEAKHQYLWFKLARTKMYTFNICVFRPEILICKTGRHRIFDHIF